MTFETVYVYNQDGHFLGYSIRKLGSQKLHTLNLWQERETDDLNNQLTRLNEATFIRAHWPSLGDPDVQELLKDPNWHTLKLSPVETIDKESSTIVWTDTPDDGEPMIDMDKSTIIYITRNAPDPSDVQRRINDACEVVARLRAGYSTFDAS